MSENTGDGPATRIRKVKWANVAVGLCITLMGIGILSGVGIFDTASRRVLAQECAYPMDASEGLSTESLNREIDECADFRGWSDLEAFFQIAQRISFPAFVMIGVVLFLAFGHARLSRSRFGRSAGDRLVERFDRSERTLPPPMPSN